MQQEMEDKLQSHSCLVLMAQVLVPLLDSILLKKIPSYDTLCRECVCVCVCVCVCACMHVHALLTQSCPTLCDPMDCSPPGSSVHEFPFPSPWDLPNLGIKPKSLASPALAGGFFTTSITWEVQIYILVINCSVTTSICH